MDYKNKPSFEIVKAEGNSSLDNFWKQYRIRNDIENDVFLFINNNNECIYKETRQILTDSEDYIITQDDNNIIEMHGEKFPMEEDIVFRFAISKEESHYSHDVSILDTERGLRILICASLYKGYGNIIKKFNLYYVENLTLKQDKDFHMAVQKSYKINLLNAGYRGFYCEGSFRPYYKERSVKTNLNINPTTVRTSKNGIDILIRDRNASLVDSRTMKIIANYDNYRATIGQMLITKNEIFDIDTGELLFKSQDGPILYLTEKEDNSGYFVWIANDS